MMEEHEKYDVVVVGAGMAGLTAARALAVGGFRVVLIEAKGCVGGRILTLRVSDEVIELGAEFVHGRPPELLALIQEAGLELVERDGSTLRFLNGSLSSDDEEGEDGPFALLEELKDYSGGDLSFAEFLEGKKLSEEVRAAVIGFVEGFNAADHHVIGIKALGVQQKAEDAIDGDRAFHVAGGYDQLPEFLAARFKEQGGEIHLNTRVRRIEWQDGRVVALCDGGTFSARQAVITLPLGVLQRGDVEFHPPLPATIREILVENGPMRMGDALRFTMIFKKRFWSDLLPQPAFGELSFLFTPGKVPPVWWTSHPEESSTLTGWIGGPGSSALAGLSSEALGERACAVLAKAFGLDAAHVHELLVGCHTHDWSADPYSRGAYSYVAKNGMDAPARFGETVGGTLYFAGEHTTTDGHWGTVHAALGSGLRVAGEIVNGRGKSAT